jgi:hypothetical protein
LNDPANTSNPYTAPLSRGSVLVFGAIAFAVLYALAREPAPEVVAHRSESAAIEACEAALRATALDPTRASFAPHPAVAARPRGAFAISLRMRAPDALGIVRDTYARCDVDAAGRATLIR